VSIALTRPHPHFAPGSGLVRNELFQIAYATNDMDRACAIFAERFGVKEFRRLEGALPEGGHVRMEIGWAGAMMYELVCATGPGGEVFRTCLPSEGFAIRPHHLGYFLPSAEAWEAVLREIADSGRKIARETDIPGYLKAVIVEAPELGHYLEYILPEAAGVAFFEGAPNGSDQT
jgi:hypothetical protein